MKNYIQPGERISVLDSQLTKPTGHTFTKSGDPVLMGRVAGVANQDAAAGTDTVVVSLKGVFNLTVKAVHNGLSLGETVYIDPTTCALSDDQTGTPFGVALGVVNAGSSGTLIPVRLFGATPGATGFFS